MDKVSVAGMELDIGPGRFDSMEKLFLAAAEKGDKKAILYALENAPDLNINATDKDGRGALVIAIQNGNSDIIVVLLEHGIQLGDALLRAVDEQFVYAVQMICEHIKQKNIPEFLNCRALNGDFHPDITPIVLAAHHNNYDIIKILLEYGARIEDPDYYAFSTETNTLQHSLGMLNIYRALASQAFISLTSLDPINTAFERCVRLRKLCHVNPEFSEEFSALANQCEQFAADILGHIRNQSEQTCVLYHDPCFYSLGDSGIGPYKVKVAIHHEQRKFVAHPHCQQRLTQLWYEGLPTWYMTNWISSTMSTFFIGVFYPLLCLLYIVYPWGGVGRLMRVPHVQFVCHVSSMLCFLLLLGMQSTFVPKYEVDTADDQRGKSPSWTEWLIAIWVIGLTWVEIKELWYYGSRYLKDRWNFLDFFTLSLYWAAIALRIVTYRRHGGMVPDIDLGTATMWYSTIDITTEAPDVDGTPSGENSTPFTGTMTTVTLSDHDKIKQEIQKLSAQLIDIDSGQTEHNDLITGELGAITNILTKMDEKLKTLEDAASASASVATGGSRRRGSALAVVQGGSTPIAAKEGRANWSAYDPLLISEGLFAIAKVLSFLRPICYTVMNRHVGPMQISLGNMMFDICKFLLIFCFVWFAFSLGMNQLYGYYSYITRQICDLNNPMEEHCKQPFETVQYTLSTLFWALFGLPEMTIVDIRGVDHLFTETVGLLLYAAYHVIAIVVLLNVLIAMMSNTYTRIEEDADIQWKFSRSKLWMSYFEGRGSLPAPFNVVPTPKSVLYFFRWIRGRFGSEKYKQKIKDRNKAKMEEKEQQYREIMGKLVRRYIFDVKRDDDENNQEQWVNRLKQDISGFKYEMFEALTGMDKKMNEMEQRIQDGGEKKPGTQMLHKMESVVKRPHRRDSMQSVKSGCSDFMNATSRGLLDYSNNADSSAIFDDGNVDQSKNNRNERGHPKSASMPCNIAAWQYPPDWEKNEPILFIDEDPDVPILGGPPRKESKKRRFSANHMMNHIGSRQVKRKKSNRDKNTTRV